MYFQLTRAESWALEDGIVKDGSASIDQGVGVRALAGEKTGFAYSDEIMLPALDEAARAARAIAASGAQGSVKAWEPVGGHQLYMSHDPRVTLKDEEKIAWLERLDRETRRMDPRIKQVMASVHAVHELVLIARSDGALAADARPLVRMNVTVIVEQNGRREQGYAGCGGRYGLEELVRNDRPLTLGREAVRQALVNLEAVPAPAGTMTRWSQAGLARSAAARRPSDTGWKAISIARALLYSAIVSASASPRRAARWSMTALFRPAAAHLISTTRAHLRSARR